jgi:hypothetical protein
MDEDKFIAAILAASMLPSFSAPQSPRGGPLTKAEEEELLKAVGHAIALYQAVLTALQPAH